LGGQLVVMGAPTARRRLLLYHYFYPIEIENRDDFPYIA
jgi:hypothetical protein